MNKYSSFKYELCSFPASPFDVSGLFSKPIKQELEKAIKQLSSIDTIVEKLSLTWTYVLDKGTLLHTIP